ncbi:hypothetical protein BGZ89_005723 [Linnemannia elongata]|nr:hypothetical protein BGZ89_005723 [Linnemannia elongata]
MVPGITTVVTDKVHGSTFIRGSCLLLHVRYLVLFTSGALVHAVLDGWVLGLVSKIEWTVPKPWRKFARQYATLIKDITDTLSSGEAVVYPPRKLVFEMMDHLAPKEIRAIMVGQNPYPDDNARGIPFASAKGRNTSSLEKMHKELQREYPYLNIPRNINRLVLSWVNQGTETYIRAYVPVFDAVHGVREGGVTVACEYIPVGVMVGTSCGLSSYAGAMGDIWYAVT